MSDLSDFEAQAARPDQSFTFDGQHGTATFAIEPGAEPQDALNKLAGLLLGLPADTVELLDIIEVRAWGHNPEAGGPYRYVKAKVRKVDAQAREWRDAADAWVKQRRPRPITPKPVQGDCTVFWPIADTQFGKGPERFGSTPEAIARFEWAAHTALPHHLTRLRATGWRPDRIVIPLLGDLTEGCEGSYTNQPFTVELDIRRQFTLALEQVDRLIQEACRLVPEVVVTGVASNHDRNSRGSGRDNITTDADDRTLQLLDVLAYKLNDVRPQVRFVIPDDPNVTVIEDRMTVAGIHGHKPKVSSSNVPGSMFDWWSKQRSSLHPAGRAQVLVTAHFHHRFDLGPQDGRYLIGLPSMDGGSGYLADASGTWSMPGVRPFAITEQGVVGGGAEMLVWPEDRRKALEQTGVQVA